MTIKMIAFIILLQTLLLCGDTSIEWAGCITNQFMCFCNNVAGTNDLVQQNNRWKIEDILTNCKSIGVNVKSLTDDTVLYHLQMNGINDIGSTPELTLYYGTNVVLGCKFKPGDKTEVIAMDGYADNIELFEDRSQSNSDGVICAILVKKAYVLYSEIAKNAEDPIMKLKTSKGLLIDYTVTVQGATIFNPPKDYRCNPFTFKDLEFSRDFYVRKIMNRDKDELNCLNYGPSYHMRYHKSGKNEQEIEKIVCKGDSTNGYYYHIISKVVDPTQQPTEVKMYNQESFSFCCAIRIEEACKYPRTDKTCKPNSPECPTYEAGGLGKEAKYWCPGGKWLIKKNQGVEYVTLTHNLTCKRDILRNSFEATFLTNFDSGKKVSTDPENKCFTDYDCNMRSKIVFSPCEANEKNPCGQVDHDNGVLKCKDPTMKLRIANVTLNVTSFKCDPSSGNWYNKSYGIIQQRAKLSCFSGDSISMGKSEASLTSAEVYLIIGGVFVVAILVLGTLFGVCFAYIKLKGRVTVKTTKEWKQLKKNEKIEQIDKMFYEILASDDESSENLLKGLNMIEVLLDSETDYWECWDGVEPFLMRLQGALLKSDHGLWLLFSRYMFLRAKKIIDKHGWTTNKRITKANQKGLIRHVAIMLLSFALNDPNSSDAEDLICDGWRKLGFCAVSQYPHCGLLWAVIAHARPLSMKGPNGELIPFPKDKMIKSLDDIAINSTLQLPKGDEIANFGSIAKQAAFAIGALPDHQYLKSNAKRFLINLEVDKRVPLAFFEGMCKSLSRNPSQTVIDACNMWPIVNQEVLNGMFKVAPEGDWHEIINMTIGLVAYYGHFVDAERLSTRFSQTDKKVNKLIQGMSEAQDGFELAVEKEQEQLRAWFAKRTDKKELKKKPEYLTKDEKGATLDSRVVGDKPATTVTGGTQSGSNSTDGGSPVDSKSPAAAAPTSPAAAAAATPTTPTAAAATPTTPTAAAAATPTTPTAAAAATPVSPAP